MDETIDALTKIGVTIYDNNGNLRALQNILNDVSDAWHKLNEENSMGTYKVKCSCCKRWVDERRVFIHKDGIHHCCFDCY